MGRDEKDIEELRTGIRRWRETREKRSRMPADLWEEAVALARERGIHWVSNTLGLNYKHLKQRTLMASEERRDRGVESGGFVELNGSQLFGSPEMSEVVVELADGNGATVKIRLPLGAGLDVRGLAEALWGRRG